MSRHPLPPAPACSYGRALPPAPWRRPHMALHGGAILLMVSPVAAPPYTPPAANTFFTGNVNADNKFRLNDTTPPNGFDNFGTYSFDDSTGTMTWTYTPPPTLLAFYGNNITANFELSLLLLITSFVSDNCMVALETTHIFASGAPTVVTNASVLPSGGCVVGHTHYPDSSGYPVNPTVYDFSVSGVSAGDVLQFRLRALNDGGGSPPNILVAQAGYVQISAVGGSRWQYDPTTQQWTNLAGNSTDNVWGQTFSYLQMTGLELVLGGPVHFQYYDAFRNYSFLDMLGGLVELFDLEIATDPISMSVTIEPFMGVTIPDFDIDGNYTGDLTLDGYYDSTAVNDWTNKQDLNKENSIENFCNASRQTDYSMKQDGSDGGQNIWAARYKGAYLNNVIKPRINNTNIDNGIIAGVPGASRYMLPDRFAKGNVQKANRFFSPCMHYREVGWNQLGGPTWPAPQFITIFPENINDSSASAVTQVFEPKIAFFKGLMDPAAFGGWRWNGDPASPYPDYLAVRSIPIMFGVNYNDYAGLYIGGDKDPVLTYSDQLVYDASGAPVISQGLMSKFHLPRLAIMRNGQIKHAYMRLNLRDVTNFGQRNCVKVGNGLFAIIAINEYKPFTDDSCEVVMWKIANIEQTDLDNSYPSQTSITTSPLILAQYDLRYAQLLLYVSDIPTVG